MSSDLIVKLLFPVAEPAQMGLQMALAITTLTDLLQLKSAVRSLRISYFM